jgi:hypothetical protein
VTKLDLSARAGWPDLAESRQSGFGKPERKPDIAMTVRRRKAG